MTAIDRAAEVIERYTGCSRGDAHMCAHSMANTLGLLCTDADQAVLDTADKAECHRATALTTQAVSDWDAYYETLDATFAAVRARREQP